MQPKGQQNFQQSRATYLMLELYAAVQDQVENVSHLSWAIATGNLDEGQSLQDHIECLAYHQKRLDYLKPCLAAAEKEDARLNPVKYSQSV